MIAIAGFCRLEALLGAEQTFMFHAEGRDYAVLSDTPVIGNGVFLIVSDEEWEAHRIVMKPTIIGD